MEFENDAQAIEWGKTQGFSRYDREYVEVAGEGVILCGTCMPYEDIFYPFAERLIVNFFGYKNGLDPAELRDEFIKVFEEYCNCRFVNIYEQF